MEVREGSEKKWQDQGKAREMKMDKNWKERHVPLKKDNRQTRGNKKRRHLTQKDLKKARWLENKR